MATNAIYLITVVPACPLGLTQAKVTLNSLIHPIICKLMHQQFLGIIQIFNIKQNSCCPCKVLFLIFRDLVSITIIAWAQWQRQDRKQWVLLDSYFHHLHLYVMFSIIGTFLCRSDTMLSYTFINHIYIVPQHYRHVCVMNKRLGVSKPTGSCQRHVSCCSHPLLIFKTWLFSNHFVYMDTFPISQLASFFTK